jgi:beta-glucosidase
VRALYAGCDCLLYPTNLRESVIAVQKAIDDKRLDANSIQQSLERRRRWARWAALSKETNRPTRDESGWSSQIAERVVHMLQERMPQLPQPWHLTIVDDDIGGPYPAPSRDPLLSALRSGGIDVVLDADPPVDESGSTVVALFGDIRAWKGRPGYSAAAKDAVRQALSRTSRNDRLIVAFSHPRLTEELDVEVPILCAWGGEAVMQRAAARVLLREAASARKERSIGTAR